MRLDNGRLRGGGAIKRIFRSRLPERLAGRYPGWLVELSIGLAAAIAALIVRLALVPSLGERAPYALIFFAVVIAAVIAGWRSGLVALIARPSADLVCHRRAALRTSI